MNSRNGLILRHLFDLSPIMTSHGVGEKRVIVTQRDVGSPITQVAYVMLKVGDLVLEHMHPTMDEHFFILKGECQVAIGGIETKVVSNDYLFIPAGSDHKIQAVLNTEMITIGIAKEDI